MSGTDYGVVAGVPRQVIVHLECDARWHCAAPVASERTAPPNAPPSSDVRKPVLCVPFPKNEELFPSLSISALLIEKRESGCGFSAIVGEDAQCEVFNVFPAKKDVPGTSPVVLHGKVKPDLTCTFEVPKDTVKQWLDPDHGPFHARVNENLLDFRITLPAVAVGDGASGATLPGIVESKNRLFLYRKKVVVFLPGLFGSQVRLKDLHGNWVGFPQFSSKAEFVTGLVDSAVRSMLLGVAGPALVGAQVGQGVAGAVSQNVSALECDSLGKPLALPIKPTLLTLGVGLGELSIDVACDVFHACRAARIEYFGGLVPEDLFLYSVHVLAYDWRGDLTETAKSLLGALKDVQKVIRLQHQADTDDEVAVAGHSTGGLLLRYMLGEPDAESVISHAFFQAVPFRGAPKALSVLLTGRESPLGSRAIPFVEPDSITSVALNMPIVYHLAPTAKYPLQVADSPSRRAGDDITDIEGQKSALIRDAIRAGFFRPPPGVDGDKVPAPEPRKGEKGMEWSGQDKDRLMQRYRLALQAEAWVDHWNRAREEESRLLHSEANLEKERLQLEKWKEAQLVRHHLVDRSQLCVPSAWNEVLASRAREFHAKCETIGASGKWKDKAYLFFSVHEKVTTNSLSLQLLREETQWKAPTLQVGPSEAELLSASDFQAKGLEHRQELVGEDRTVRRVWRLTARRKAATGDGTVPLVSQVGFNGPVNVFKQVSGGPMHMDVPGAVEVWSRIVEALQGYSRADLPTHYATTDQVDPVDGVLHLKGDHDPDSCYGSPKRWTQ